MSSLMLPDWSAFNIIIVIISAGWFAFWGVIIVNANIAYWRMSREERRVNDLYW